jgi:serine/threonine-protein kinase
MADESRILELLEEALDSRRTLEEVCADSPELLWEVKERWERCQNVEAQIDAMFPTNIAAKNLKRCLHLPTTLPVIPGYEIDAVLGRGGMGIVYKARHLKLNRSVAIKMLLCGELAGSDELTCLIREAQAVAGLAHANIVQVHDVGDLDGLPYFTMEFIEGGSLAQKLGGVPQPAREAASMMVLLARAVHAAHQGAVVHRDLKPSNILLTSDGTPKITDFGLARQLGGNGAVNMRIAKVGTPSYMAPEQSMGKTGAFCPSVDIYSLGAILYEMLTGRPPFKAETASETQRQLIAEEPVPPMRLNAKVPCDLQTICLKCLRKDPERRYATAADLAEDLGRFLRGEPVTARPTSLLERAFKWARRHPETALVIAASFLLAIILTVGLQRFLVNHAERRQAVETDLKELMDLQNRAMWEDARVVLARAQARLEGMSPGDLRPRVRQAGSDLGLVIKLDAIRLSRFTNGVLPYYKAEADRKYATGFPGLGLMSPTDDPVSSAAGIKASNIRSALVAALDDWAVCAVSDERRRSVLQVANLADPDPTGWRTRIRDPQTWSDPTTLTELADNIPVAAQPVPLLLALGERIGAAGGDAPAFLKRVQKEHPADFWANLILGDALVKKLPVEAAGYYRAALASRPGAAVGYTSLGDALTGQGLLEEAMAYYRKAVEIDPGYARGHTNIGNMLKRRGRLEEAIDCYRTALAVDPNYGWAHYDLANTLDGIGRLEEAMEHFKRFHQVDPTNSYVTNIVRADMARLGRGEEALLEWQRELAADPASHEPYFGYAEMCLFLHHEDQYRRARQDLLRRFGASTDPYATEKVARACLLLPGTDEEIQMAAELAQRAVAARDQMPQWVFGYFKFAEGLAEFRQEHFDSAISIMKAQAGSVMGPAPRLVTAMAQYRKGEIDEARKTLAAAIVRFDWSPRHADRRDHFIVHILRREAEAVILPGLPAFLEGKYQPRDNTDRLALLGVCRFKNLNATSARLYADAFAAEEKLVDERLGHRYSAACVAALAGCGIGDDASKLSEAERMQWRKQARQWLRNELTSLAQRVDDASISRAALDKLLAQWQSNPELAGIRDRTALENLSAVEREECAALWNRVAVVQARVRAVK